jgi:hypothetical protein
MLERDEDFIERDQVSDCCNAPILNPSGDPDSGRCTECKEYC